MFKMSFQNWTLRSKVNSRTDHDAGHIYVSASVSKRTRQAERKQHTRCVDGRTLFSLCAFCQECLPVRLYYRKASRQGQASQLHQNALYVCQIYKGAEHCFQARLQSFEKRLLLNHVCPSVRMEQLDSQWKDFRNILYLGVLLKFVDNICLITIGQKCEQPVTKI